MIMKSIQELTFDDIIKFCEAEISEGLRVEYTEDISKDTAKIVSAFANTMGGILIIGVETDEKNKPKFPIKGISNRRGIEEQIQSSCYQGIYLPVLPSVKIIPIPDTDNVVVVVLVSESVEAPHAIDGSTKIYIRIASQSAPFDKYADVDRIEYLFKRREKPRERRDKLIAQAKDKMARLKGDISFQVIQIIICPTFPYRPLIALERIPRLIDDISTEQKHRHLFGGHFRRISNGVVRLGVDSSSRSYDDSKSYSELNEYGLILHSDSVEQNKNRHPGETDLFINLSNIVKEIGVCLKFAEYFYKSVGFWGNLEINSALKNIRGKKLTYSANEFTNKIESIDRESVSNINIDMMELSSSFENYVEKVVLELCWVFEESKEEIISASRKIISSLWPVEEKK